MFGRRAGFHLRHHRAPRFVDAEKSPKGTIAMLQRMMAGTPLQVTGTLMLLGGVGLGAMIGPDLGPNPTLAPWVVGIAEVMMLAWAALTVVHIIDYTHCSAFSPVFPMAFLGHALAGPLALFGQLVADKKDMLALLGSLPLTAGGFFAVWTLYEAFQGAQRQSELKKRLQVEYRKLERARKQG